MDNKIIKQVEEFHKAFYHPVYSTPTLPEPARRILRVELLREENEEFRAAVHQCDIVEIADAIADIIYVAVGAAHEFGFGHKLDAILNEVHRSNMSKLGEDGKPINIVDGKPIYTAEGKSLKGPDGKSMKGPNYSPPNIRAILFSATPHVLEVNENFPKQK